MTAMLDLLEKSKIISSAIFFAFPYGLIGTCSYTKKLFNQHKQLPSFFLFFFVKYSPEMLQQHLANHLEDKATKIAFYMSFNCGTKKENISQGR